MNSRVFTKKSRRFQQPLEQPVGQRMVVARNGVPRKIASVDGRIRHGVRAETANREKFLDSRPPLGRMSIDRRVEVRGAASRHAVRQPCELVAHDALRGEPVSGSRNAPPSSRMRASTAQHEPATWWLFNYFE